VREVAGQLVAPVGRVRPDHHRADEGGRLEPEDELGNVVEQHGHVEGAVDPLRPEPSRALSRPGHHFGVGQPELAGQEAEPVVVRQLEDGPGNRLGRWEAVARIAGLVRRQLSWGHCISKLL